MFTWADSATITPCGEILPERRRSSRWPAARASPAAPTARTSMPRASTRRRAWRWTASGQCLRRRLRATPPSARSSGGRGLHFTPAFPATVGAADGTGNGRQLQSRPGRRGRYDRQASGWPTPATPRSASSRPPAPSAPSTTVAGSGRPGRHDVGRHGHQRPGSITPNALTVDELGHASMSPTWATTRSASRCLHRGACRHHPGGRTAGAAG